MDETVEVQRYLSRRDNTSESQPYRAMEILMIEDTETPYSIRRPETGGGSRRQGELGGVGEEVRLKKRYDDKSVLLAACVLPAGRQ